MFSQSYNFAYYFLLVSFLFNCFFSVVVVVVVVVVVALFLPTSFERLNTGGRGEH